VNGQLEAGQLPAADKDVRALLRQGEQDCDEPQATQWAPDAHQLEALRTYSAGKTSRPSKKEVAEEVMALLAPRRYARSLLFYRGSYAVILHYLMQLSRCTDCTLLHWARCTHTALPRRWGMLPRVPRARPGRCTRRPFSPAPGSSSGRSRAAPRVAAMASSSSWSRKVARLQQNFNSAGISLFLQIAGSDHPLALPHVSVPDISHVDWEALAAAGFRGCVFDKDNTICRPFALEVEPRLQQSMARCKASACACRLPRLGPSTPRPPNPLAAPQAAFQDRVVLFSNSAGLQQYDPDGAEAAQLERQFGLRVLRHSEKKPAGGCAEAEAQLGCSAAEMVMIGDRCGGGRLCWRWVLALVRGAAAGQRAAARSRGAPCTRAARRPEAPEPWARQQRRRCWGSGERRAASSASRSTGSTRRLPAQQPQARSRPPTGPGCAPARHLQVPHGCGVRQPARHAHREGGAPRDRRGADGGVAGARHRGAVCGALGCGRGGGARAAAVRRRRRRGLPAIRAAAGCGRRRRRVRRLGAAGVISCACILRS
jgi:phosphatidylglycerophosphatase GEP4